MIVLNQLVCRLSRPLFIVVSCVFLNACGGDSLNLANGIGGTGITAIGRITAFGSVYVNGVHYNTDNAQFSYNGETAQQGDLYLGNIVRVKGTINPDKKTGVAELVTYSDTLTGPVTQEANDETIEVMKQSVVIDDLTLLHGFKKLADLNNDNIVEVSGFSTANGKIKASSIRLKNERYVDGTELELEGFISNIDKTAQTFNVDGLTINYAQSQFSGITADTLVDDLYLIITTSENIQGDTLTASNILLDDQLLSDGELYEMEGIVTSFSSIEAFSVDDSPIITNSQTEITPSTDALKKGTYVQVTGTSNAQGKLVADTITIIDTASEVVIETTLQSIDVAAQEIKVLGQTVQINTSTLLLDDRRVDTEALSLSDFAVGDSVMVVVRQDENNQLIVVRLSKVETLTDVFIGGFPEAVDSEQATLSLFNQTIYTDNAAFVGSEQNDLSQSEFFNAARDLQTEILITGQVRSDGVIDATRLELWDIE